MKKLFAIAVLALLSACSKKEEPAAVAPVAAPPVAKVETYRVAWSHYTGWEPWGYAKESGILDRWAKKYGINIELSLINDYVESINLYTAGKFDACVMTNMDALTIPAVGGIDSTVVVVGDFSNGNDGIVLKKGSTVKDLKGRSVKLVELSVSHYLLARALDMNGLSEKDLSVVNTSDADIASVFSADDKGAAVTWNPPLAVALKSPGTKLVFDSSKIPGEIMDLLVVKTAAPEALKKALTGAWYETLATMSGEASGPALEAMAKQAGGTLDEFKAQLKTTAMFYEPLKAADFAASAEVGKTMQSVRQFSFSKGLFGEGATSVDVVGIELNDGSVLGSKDNVKLRFTDRYMREAAAATP